MIMPQRYKNKRIFFYFCTMIANNPELIGFIFAAGLGTRLYPLTANRPKALVKYEGVPLLERVVTRMTAAGVRRIVVNVHHFADQIIDFLKARRFDADIVISDERAYLRDTAGGLKFASPWLQDCRHVLIHNVDIVSDISLEALLEAHVSSCADATLAVRNRKTSRYFVFDPSTMRLQGWHNVSTDERKGLPVTGPTAEMAFSGIHVIRREMLESIPTVEKSSITDFYLQSVSDFEIIGYEHNSDFWCDVGKYEEYANVLS